MSSNDDDQRKIDDVTLAKYVIKRYYENGAKPKITIIEYARSLEVEIEELKKKILKNK